MLTIAGGILLAVFFLILIGAAITLILPITRRQNDIYRQELTRLEQERANRK